MKALLFDACDILYHRPRFEQDLDSFFGPQRRRIRLEKSDEFNALQAQTATGKLSVQEMMDSMLDLYGLASDRRDQGCRFLSDAMADVDFFDGVSPALHALKADGFKLAVVTNSFQRSATKLSWFANVGIDSVWDAFISSSETGILKPAPKSYLAALEQLDCAPSQAAFVAHAANELEGAKAVGLTTVAFNRDDPSVCADHIIEQFGELVDLARRLPIE